jgi:acetylglutamate kinase
MKMPKGFRFSGIHAGIKPVRRDMALVVSDAPAAAAGCFTQNKAQAAPVIDAAARLPTAGLRAVVINSGNANALTGEAGVEDARALMRRVAEALSVKSEEVVSASTGVIGVRMPMDLILPKVPLLVTALGGDPEPAAEAMMTTDTRMKLASRSVDIDGKPVTLLGLCKGSGMIAPALATMIAVIASDAAISPEMLSRALRLAMPTSFNALTVDNDMSTNDAVFALSNGLAENAPIEAEGAAFVQFAAVLRGLCEDLARDIAADGEGATKLLEVTVLNAPSEEMAIDLARSVCGSSLVKAAMFGADPNWGRVLASIGARAGSADYAIDPHSAKVTIQDLVVFDKGPQPFEAQKLRAAMREPEVKVRVDVRAGEANGRAWGCDLSYDYVKINGDYTSLIVQKDDGSMAKDDRLSNYSPKFKVTLLVEALSYISKLEDRRVVIKYGGAAMVKEALKRSFCQDIELLRSAGMIPIIVHGGGPEISKTLERFGNKSEFVNGIRITSADDMRVVEMVLSGLVNAEIVTLLNQRGGMAVGMSGKDGALLKAKKLQGENGRDLGQVGEVVSVNREFLEMLLAKEYVPVISPVGIGDDGLSYNINADTAAAAVAAAVGAHKLIYVTDVPGLLDNGELVSKISVDDLDARLQRPDSGIAGGMRVKTQSVVRAMRDGVQNVHIIDGRAPHSLIAELFTDHGIGTLVTP